MWKCLICRFFIQPTVAHSKWAWISPVARILHTLLKAILIICCWQEERYSRETLLLLLSHSLSSVWVCGFATYLISSHMIIDFVSQLNCHPLGPDWIGGLCRLRIGALLWITLVRYGPSRARRFFVWRVQIYPETLSTCHMPPHQSQAELWERFARVSVHVWDGNGA